jgi:hypothetical protein
MDQVLHPSASNRQIQIVFLCVNKRFHQIHDPASGKVVSFKFAGGNWNLMLLGQSQTGFDPVYGRLSDSAAKPIKESITIVIHFRSGRDIAGRKTLRTVTAASPKPHMIRL